MGNLQNKIQQSAQLQRISTPLRSIDSTQRKAVIESADSWIGTPFHHQGRLKNVGVDCIGVIIGIAREFGFDKVVNFEDYTSYSRNPDGKRMAYGLAKYLIKINKYDALPGDMFHLSFIQYPQHIVMLMPDCCILHAHESDKKVIHHRMNPWWFDRIAGTYRFRGLN